MDETRASHRGSDGNKLSRPFANHAWLLALSGATLAIVVALVVSTAAFVHPGKARASGASPTPTQPLIPMPAVRSGFQAYTEAPSNFSVQYPLGWQSIPQNPGVEIDDSTTSPTYIMQILLPTQGSDAQTDWVAYEFNNLKATTGTSDFTQVGGRALVSVNGTEWTSALAQLQQGTTAITVRVLVTTHRDRVYIINLLAANTAMDAAQQRYFNTMLSTFTFLS